MKIAKERFLKKFEIENVERRCGLGPCWLWNASCSTSGHGNFSYSNKTIGSHRFSYILYTGPIPEGMQVLHKCDNPACVNPKHLFLGTQLDNVKDMINKGRINDRTGEKHNMAKATENEVLEIRRLYVPRKVTMTELGKKFSLSKTNICDIINRRIWTNI